MGGEDVAADGRDSEREGIISGAGGIGAALCGSSTTALAKGCLESRIGSRGWLSVVETGLARPSVEIGKENSG